MDNIMPSEEARKEFLRLARNIQNAALCISEWAEQSEANAMERSAWINGGCVEDAQKVLEDLKNIGAFLDIAVKEV